jgi:hypothetical protein
LELQSKIEDAEIKVGRIPEYERYLATTQQQLQASEKANAAEVIQLQRKLATERELRSRIVEGWREAQVLIAGGEAKDKIEALRTIANADDLSVGVDEFKAIVVGAAALEQKIGAVASQLDAQAATFDALLTEQMRLWKAKETDALRVIEVKRKELEAQGVRLDMAFIQKLAKDEASYKKTLDVLKTWKPFLATQRQRRAEILRQRWAARERVGTIRDAYARRASETLKTTLSDLHVSLKFVRSGLAPEAAEQIQQVMGWRTNQVPRATLLMQTLTLPGLLEAIEKKNTAALTSLAFDDGTRPFNNHDAAEIFARLGEPKVKFALERCTVHDLPRLRVTKMVEGRDGKPQYLTREFSKLSLGQQQSILLSLLLSSDGNDPLIIDQPEDNLDGEFIYSSFVPVLRRAKERRQIVIVTHNANIAVLGDAEQIIVMKSQSDRGFITARGSIDDPTTRAAACGILEGAKEAFIRRARVYGVLEPSNA